MDITVRELLSLTSIGQMVRVIFLDIDGDETGEVLEFENDHIDLNKHRVKAVLSKFVEFISTEDDFLRVEVEL